MSKKFDHEKYERQLRKIQSAADSEITDNEEISDLMASLSIDQLRSILATGIWPEDLLGNVSDGAWDWVVRTAATVKRLYPRAKATELPTWALRALVFAEKQTKKKCKDNS